MVLTTANSLLCTAIAGLALATQGLAATINDPGFDGALTSTTQSSAGAADAGAWIMNGSTWTAGTVQGQRAATRATNFTRYLVQVVEDNHQSTGEWAFSFDYYSVDSNNDNVITPQVYGTDSDTFSLGLTAGGTTELTELHTTYAVTNSIKNGAGNPAKTVDWTHYSGTVDLGATGYKYLAIRFIGTEYNASGSHSDVIAIDNVSLVPEPGAASLALVGLGTMLYRRR